LGNKVLGRILDVGLVPVVRVSSTQDAVLVAEAIQAGGVSILEVTMTVPRALQVIEKVAGCLGDQVILGAGTVLDAETARSASLSGAEFVVTPCVKPAVIEMCKRYSKTIILGAMTPTEILTAWEAGADLVKVFPCDSLGGAKYLKALKAPLPQIRLVPTGGVSLDMVDDLIAAGASALGVGSELVDNQSLMAGNFTQITENAKRFLQAIKLARQPMTQCPTTTG